jgi:hypothetical protein
MLLGSRRWDANFGTKMTWRITWLGELVGMIQVSSDDILYENLADCLLSVATF